MKTILVVLSEFGYWGEELVGPLDILDKQGYTIEFMTPKGRRPRALPVSMDPTYMDPPLGRTVVNEHFAKRTKEVDDSTRLDNPLSLADWFPERPYYSVPDYLRQLEVYNNTLDEKQAELAKYDALLLVGGSGPCVDMVNNQRLHDVILGFIKMNKPVAGECYGVACLAFARDWYSRKSIIWGKHVTGHALEYDYKDGTGFYDIEKLDWIPFNMGPPPYPLEFILRDAVGPDGMYHGNVGRKTSAIVDYPFITSRSTASSVLCGELLVQVLENGLKRFGW